MHLHRLSLKEIRKCPTRQRGETGVKNRFFFLLKLIREITNKKKTRPNIAHESRAPDRVIKSGDCRTVKS